MLRGPAHSLRERIDDLSWDFAYTLAIAPLLPLTLYAVYLEQRLAGRGSSMAAQGLYVVASVGAVTFVAWRLMSVVRNLRTCQLGLEAEIAAAEELNRLMQR